MANSEILLYQTEDGQTKIDVRLEEENVWLSQVQMAELFQTSKQNVSLHIKNIYEEGELDEISTVKDYLTVQTEGKRKIQRSINFYNLDVIISVGYRVKSHRGTQFRIWATKQLKEFLIKGFCSTKSMYYYGLKLHALAFHRPDHLPFPESIVITPASENDLNVHKQNWCNIPNRSFFGDKIYHDTELLKDMASSSNSTVLTPVKAVKNQLETIKQWDKAANDLYSRAVSSVRQPIESLFNWIIEKTGIQKASKVRSTKGLLVHVFGRIAAAFIFLIFNS